MRGCGGEAPRKIFKTTPFRLSENVGKALLAFFSYSENFEKAALSSKIFRNGCHFCKNKNRTVKYYAHDNRFCVVRENIKPKVLKVQTELGRSVLEDRGFYSFLYNDTTG